MDTSGHSASASVTIYVDGSTEHSQQQYDPKQIQIYPNPGEGIFNLDFQNLPRGLVSVCIYNTKGQKVMCRELETSEDTGHTQSLTLDLSDQPKGVYLIRMKDADNVFKTKQIILQ